MEGGYGRGIHGVVPVGITVYRVEVSVEKNWIGAHFGYGRMRPSGNHPEGLVSPRKSASMVTLSFLHRHGIVFLLTHMYQDLVRIPCPRMTAQIGIE